MKIRGKFKTLLMKVGQHGIDDQLSLDAHRTGNDQLVSRYVVPPEVVRMLAAVATNAWRAKAKMADPLSGEIREDMKRVGRHVETILRNLSDVGIKIRDYTGETYDEGQPMKVVASKPTAGLEKKQISETLLPSIFWNDHLIQNGEIEIAVPLVATDDLQTHSQ